MVVEEAVLFSSLLIEKMSDNPQVCGVGWDGVDSFLLLFFFLINHNDSMGQ